MPAKTFVKTRKSTADTAVSVGPAASEMELAIRSQTHVAAAMIVGVNPADVDARRQKIAEAAYRRAQSRGFAPGAEVDDWLQAEAEVDASSGEAPQIIG